MIHKISWIVVSIIYILITGCNSSQKGKVKEQPNTSINVSDRILFVKRSGSAYLRGKQYGIAAKEEIKGQLKVWSDLCEEEIELTQEELFDLLNEKTGFIKAIQQYAPDLLEEINGMADGAEVSANDLLCLNLAEETIIYFAKDYEKCTNIGLKGEKKNIIAYNLDLPEFLRKYKPVILQDSSQFIYAFPGIIATGGMNKNFTVTTNSLPDLNMDLNGLPLPFFIRKMLQFSDEQKAINFLQSTPLGSPQNLMIVGRQGVYNFECSANQIAQYENPKNSQILYHTNHAIVNTDIRGSSEDLNCTRFNYLDKTFGQNGITTISMATVKQAISDEDSEIRYDGNYFSFIGWYPKNKTQPPYLEILIPQSDNSTILSFKEDN
ncbi:MAG: C45 family autoproteolytic acyltransferase/hydrolase [Thermonemataceae bacterium]